jgi:hypothetical protein
MVFTNFQKIIKFILNLKIKIVRGEYDTTPTKRESNSNMINITPLNNNI